MEKDKLLIIGGTGDIGSNIIKDLSKKYDIINIYRNEQKNELLKETLLDSFKLDLTNKEEIPKVIKKVFEKHPKISKVIFANGEMINNMFITTSNEEIEQSIFINLESLLLVSREIYKQLLKNKKVTKNVVYISSVAGEMGNNGQVLYSTVKGSVFPLVKSLSREYAKKGIIVNSLSLGLVENTKMEKELIESKKVLIKEHIPLKRFCNFDDINLSLYFLLETNYYTGQILSLNGGLF